MKVKDVPQDPETHLPRARLTFAVDDEGHYQHVESVGNEIGTLTVKMLWEHYNEQVEAAAARVRSGQESPLAFFMAHKLMDPGLMAKYSGIARWRIKRHLRPSVFKKLKNPVLQGYADFFGVTLEEFISPPLDSKDFTLGKKER
jgi:hypothetical protein